MTDYTPIPKWERREQNQKIGVLRRRITKVLGKPNMSYDIASSRVRGWGNTMAGFYYSDSLSYFERGCETELLYTTGSWNLGKLDDALEFAAEKLAAEGFVIEWRTSDRHGYETKRLVVSQVAS